MLYTCFLDLGMGGTFVRETLAGSGLSRLDGSIIFEKFGIECSSTASSNSCNYSSSFTPSFVRLTCQSSSKTWSSRNTNHSHLKDDLIKVCSDLFKACLNKASPISLPYKAFSW